MKKIMAILLVLCVVLSLFACSTNVNSNTPNASTSASAASAAASTPSQKPSQTSVQPSSTPAQPSSSPASSPSMKPSEDSVGFYDPNYNYSKNPKYKVVYMMSSASVLNDQFDKAYKAWAGKANCEYSSFSANNDNDAYVNALMTYAAQGVKGFLLDPDPTVWPRIVDVMKELKIPYSTGTSQARDSGGKPAAPSVGFNNIKFGSQMAQFCLDYSKKNWPDAKPGETAMLFEDYSIVPEIHNRMLGAQDTYNKSALSKENFIIVDVTATNGQMNADGGYNLAAPTFAAHPNIKYWLVCAFFDDFADGAARAAEQAHIDKNTVITCTGGNGLIAHWDAGESSCWKSAVFTAETLFAEPLFFELYAFMSGQATPETIYPKWINKAKGDKYAVVELPTINVTQDNYKEYLEWVDKITGINWSPYDKDYKGTEFTARNTPSF